MDLIKKVFPYSFGAASVKDLIIKVLVYLVASSLLGWLLGLIPLLGGILSWVVGIYCTVGWILVVLDFLKVIK